MGKYAHPQTSVLSIPFLRVGCAKSNGCLRTLERQLEVTGKRFNDVFVFLLGIEPAMNWVLEHMGDPGMTSDRQSQKPFWLRCRACSAELIVCQEKFCNFRHKYETWITCTSKWRKLSLLWYSKWLALGASGSKRQSRKMKAQNKVIF